jgi:phospholipase/carboxylesterase
VAHAVEVERRGPPPADAALVVVALHGRNQSPGYMVENLVDPLAADHGRDDIAWLLPAAPGGTWYPNRFLSPLADNQPALDDALAALTGVEAELAGRDPRSVVWCGFSQGACLVSEHLARRPRRWGGLLALTGGMIGPRGTELNVAGSFAGMPAYFGVGDSDDWVPVWRVEETAHAYRRAGAVVELDVFAGRPHEISRTELVRAARLLAGGE